MVNGKLEGGQWRCYEHANGMEETCLTRRIYEARYGKKETSGKSKKSWEVDVEKVCRTGRIQYKYGGDVQLPHIPNIREFT